MRSSQLSIQDVISHHQKTLGEIEQKHLACEKKRDDFICENKINHERYVFLQANIPKKEKEALISGEQCKESIISSASKVNIFGENPDELEKHIEKFRQLVKKSYPEINQMKDELELLKKQIEPFLDQNRQELSTLKKEEEKAIMSVMQGYAIFWKKKTSCTHQFFDAIEKGDFETVKRLYTARWANRTNQKGYTPLITAIIHGQLQITAWLLRQGVDPELPVNMDKERRGITPLCAAIMYENNESKSTQGAVGIMTTLIAHGANIHKTTETGQFTPLHWAAFKGSKQCIDFLLSSGADASALDQQKNKPFALFSLVRKEAKDFKEIEALFVQHAQHRAAKKKTLRR